MPRGDTHIYGPVSIVAGNKNVIGDENVVASGKGQAAGPGALVVGEAGVIAKGRSAQATSGRSAVADRGASATADETVATNVGFDRVRRAPWWSKLLGVTCVIAVVGAVLLVLIGGDKKIVLAGFVLAVASGLAAAIPLFRG